MRFLAHPLSRLAVLGAIALAAAACGGAQAGAPTPDPAAPGPEIAIVARDLAFTEATVSAPAGTPFRIVFENAEGAPHNVAVYRDATLAERISIGEIFSGPATRTQAVPALEPGDYLFRCDVHPDMVGTLAVR